MVDDGADAGGGSFPVRAVAYVRVSQAREGMVSPELQVTAIQEYCRHRGYVVCETLQDLDLSGRFWRLRQVERAIAMVEADQADVIVVWRWSRVSRNRLDWAMAVDRVEAAGGRLESATEGFDTSTSSGRLARGMLAELAAFESDRTADIWREIKDRRAGQGLPPNGAIQFGYRKRPDGSYVPDRKTGPVVAQLYQRYVDGQGHFPLCKWLNETGVRTPRTKRAWGQQTLAQVMDNGFAAGLVKWRGKLLPGAHKSLIDADLWEAYLTAREARRLVHAPRAEARLLSGLLWCGCGAQMHNTHRRGTTTYPKYTCHHHPQTLSGTCISRDRCEGMVRRWLHLLVTDDHTRATAEAAVGIWVDRQAERAAALRTQVASATDDERPGLLAELGTTRVAALLPPPVEVAQAVLEDWDVATPDVLRERLRLLVTRVEVYADRAEPLLQVHTTWGTVEPFIGWRAQARPAPPQLPPRHRSPAAEEVSVATYSATAGRADRPVPDIDPLQMLTPAEAALVTGVTTRSLWLWARAGRLPHTAHSLVGHRLYYIQDLRAVRPKARRTGHPTARTSDAEKPATGQVGRSADQPTSNSPS